MQEKQAYADTISEEESKSPFHREGMICRDECLFKKCCKKYKRKGRHCRKCPKL